MHRKDILRNQFSMKYHFKVFQEESKLWAECVELEGCHAEGNSKDELYKNMKDILALYLNDSVNPKRVFSKPNPKLKGNDP